MADSVLSNPQFPGADGKSWPFLGQIADDSTWRDNILPGKFESANTIPGWGRRYKVRIMGLDDPAQEVTPDDQLRWANIKYPVTAGSGGGNSFQTSALRQGMFVTGYFADGATQQVPIIDGVLGQNAQTAMQMATGMTGGKAFKSMSGFSETKQPYKGSSKPKVPHEALVVGAPSSDTSTPPPGTGFDKFGLPNLPKTPAQLAMIASSLADGDGLSGIALDNKVGRDVRRGLSNLSATQSLASNGPIENATKENPDAVHQLSAGDLKRQRKLEEKIVTMKPDDPVQSAMKAIQTTVENLSNELEFAMDAMRSYSGMISSIGNPMEDMQKLIGDAACQISKYMKIIFDKVMNYVTKEMNKAMVKVVNAMPMSLRYQMADMKEVISELTLCMYGKITNSLCGTISGMLNDMFKPDDLKKKAEEEGNDPEVHDPDAPNTYIKVPACVAEEMVGEVLSIHQDQINDANTTLINNMDTFIDDLQSQMAGITGTMSEMMTKMGGINGSMTAALGFANIKINVFGCELKPKVQMADYYTLARGGASAAQQQLPSAKAVEEKANLPATHSVVEDEPYVEIPKTQQNTVTTQRVESDEAMDTF